MPLVGVLTVSRAQYSSLVFFLFAGVVFFCAAAGTTSDLAPVTREMLCITEGDISGRAESTLSVNTPKMRAYVNGSTTPEAEVRFKYLGGTGRDVPLGSGEMRRQFGLKLLAEDACNLVYVMWRIEPESKVVVSIKSNRGQHTSQECGNRGYVNIKPRHTTAVPALRPAAMHTLHAAIKKEEMQVFVDGGMVWEGSLGPEVSYLHGPVGVRSDNARLEFMLWTHVLRDGFGAGLPSCGADTGE